MKAKIPPGLAYMSDDKFIELMTSLRDCLALYSGAENRKAGIKQTKKQNEVELNALMNYKRQKAIYENNH